MVDLKKKQGKDCDLSQFRAQLDALGLKIIQVTADGNCFFRAIADQLEGNEDEHNKYRNMIVLYIVKNREMFEPFIEDDVPFEDYCKTMDDDGTWAGNMELQAASLVTRSNICIHRNMSPRWYIRNFEDTRTRMIHLSYHDGEHYNSVRSKEDACGGPARPVVIEVLLQTLALCLSVIYINCLFFCPNKFQLCGRLMLKFQQHLNKRKLQRASPKIKLISVM